MRPSRQGLIVLSRGPCKYRLLARVPPPPPQKNLYYECENLNLFLNIFSSPLFSFLHSCEAANLNNKIISCTYIIGNSTHVEYYETVCRVVKNNYNLECLISILQKSSTCNFCPTGELIQHLLTIIHSNYRFLNLVLQRISFIPLVSIKWRKFLKSVGVTSY
jgi:hypothetical protein